MPEADSGREIAAQGESSQSGRSGSPEDLPEIVWRTLLPGLELGLTTLPESKATGDKAELPANAGSAFVVLRIDPDRHPFTLSMASEKGQALSLADWSRKERLVAGINAAMYLPDNLTSTGYMRSEDSVNNHRVGGRLGAFFVAGRRKADIPRADIIEKGTPGWQERLEDYGIVVQNYRFLSSDGRLLWPGGGQMHSMAVVGRDRRGNIMFILSQEPLSVERFAWYLANFPLELTTVMYVEGGRQAGLFVRTDGAPGEGEERAKGVSEHFAGAAAYVSDDCVIHVWKGRQSLLGTKGNPDAALPNIIGVRRK